MARDKQQTENSGLGRANFAIPLIRHRALLWQFTLRNLELRHKGSYLGLAWSVLNPLLMLGLYVFVFGYVFGGKTPNQDPRVYSLSLFTALCLFHLLAEVIGTAPTIIVSNPNFVKKVVFPLDVLPVAAVGASVVHFLVSIGLVLLGTLCLGDGLDLGILWLPVIFLPVVALALGVAWFLSAIGVFFRDITQFTGFLSTALMFASAVFYPAASIPEKSPLAWQFLRVNPLIHAIELARDVLIRQQPIHWGSLAYLYLFGLGSALLGYWVFHKLRPTFADVL